MSFNIEGVSSLQSVLCDCITQEWAVWTILSHVQDNIQPPTFSKGSLFFGEVAFMERQRVAYPPPDFLRLTHCGTFFLLLDRIVLFCLLYIVRCLLKKFLHWKKSIPQSYRSIITNVKPPAPIIIQTCGALWQPTIQLVPQHIWLQLPLGELADHTPLNRWVG